MKFVRHDQPISETLMASLAMIMGNELANRYAYRAFIEEDHALQTGFLDAAYKSLGVGIQIRRMNSFRT